LRIDPLSVAKRFVAHKWLSHQALKADAHETGQEARFASVVSDKMQEVAEAA
jgi:hypothetical protein